MDRGTESSLSKFAGGTELCGAADTLEGRDAIKRDLDRVERRDCVNLMKFNKAKCKVLHMGWGNPKNKYRLGGECIESGLEEKTWGMLLTRSSTCPDSVCLQPKKSIISWSLSKAWAAGDEALESIAQEVLDAPSLEVFRARLDGALSHLVYWNLSLPMAGGLELDVI
ncbi:hypothetical protein DUI87_23051 [Hirundo rustica rustica]|uniref:Rna-directed dna polymerase from mobile element jockey-like n=1 Tax=Hirundo rustica rustica TaxID=333673 RepID=A0A3M0JH80_HIRRU|nr:hypothetical protein DUI87_23051 [Hirundo rustica rustica]